jgi:iron complex outermembrane receptor protein
MIGRDDASKNLSVWASPSLNFFEFEDYQQGTSDLSGNQLTGTPKVFGSAGIDFSSAKGFNFQFTTNYCSSMPLDDRNTVYAGEYWIFGLRAGYEIKSAKNPIEFMAGVDNLANRKYSLGHDLNAAGGRFFNAAPGRNLYAGVIFKQQPRKRK